ncbi:VWFA and cache domain-containing protein 1 isoform X1 [Magallana gigas]|uniref:VWFA and cache domain-containing protein 1 isoform X1 n=2 Tax=Magallana gigas TaxID=29159 RepID=UPI00333FF243
MRVRYLLVCLLVVKHVVQQNAQEISGDILANELNKVADSVGWSFLQNEYNKMRYQETRLDGEKQVREIAGKIGGRMIKVDNALKKLKEAVEEDQLSSIEAPQDCCVDRNYQENIRFRTQVSEEEICYSKPSYVIPENLKFPSSKVLAVMKSNLDVKHLQFQYIGLNSGLYINYPATKLTDCDTYDPRFRPFYVSTTTTIPRDVVVVLETSSAMRGDKLFEAKHAVITVMETLGIEDRFGLIVFNDDVKTLKECYENQLVPVTSATTKSFRDFLTSQVGEGGTDFTAALRKAFMFFKANMSAEKNNRDNILLFVSAGEHQNEKGNPLEVIREENEALQNRVVINTFGIGTGLNSDDKELLRNMAEQTLNNNSYGYVKSGKTTFFPNNKGTSLREAMGTYYDYFSVPISLSPTYTQLYKDFFSNESIITGCLPIAFNGAFSGVVCADILISELVAEILYLQQEEFSYAFIMDGEERTLVHPLLPDPRDVEAKEQDINNIYNFETSGDVSDVIDSMKKGLEGKKTLQTTIIEARGEKYFEGESQQSLNAVFYWTPIIAPGSNFSLCIVTEQNNIVRNIESIPQPSQGDFLYHRWDLNQWPAPFCRHFNRYATQEKSTVKLSPDAFIEAYSYTGVKETEVRVKQYKDYLSGDIFTNPGLKVSAVKSIRLTYPIEKFWTTTSREEAPYLVWRYVMTENGVTRVYPGVRLTDDYDYKLRPWYHRTVSQKTVNVVSAPYEDSWGSGRVISLTKTILQGGTNPDRKLEAVIGTDFSIFYFNQMLEDRYPICAARSNYSCILIDNSGFLVMHPFFIETTSSINSQIHLTYKEGRISRLLIEKGIMYRQPCRDTGNKKEQFTYRVKLPDSLLSGIVDSKEGYQLRPVPGSNLFLILKQRRMLDEESCCNSEHSTSPNSIQCSVEQCTCLCYKDLSFNECKNEYVSTRGFVPCSPQLPTLRSVSTPEKDKTKNLPTCFPTDCACRKTESDCFRTSGCSWCTSDKDGNVGDGFCDLKEICPSQQCLKDDCSVKSRGSECYPTVSEPVNGWLYIGVSVAVVASVIIFIVFAVFIFRKIRQNSTDDTYLDAAHDFDMTNKPPLDCEDYNTTPNYYLAELSATSEESINTKAS